jgi:hypothetical protein
MLSAIMPDLGDPDWRQPDQGSFSYYRDNQTKAIKMWRAPAVIERKTKWRRLDLLGRRHTWANVSISAPASSASSSSGAVALRQRQHLLLERYGLEDRSTVSNKFDLFNIACGPSGRSQHVATIHQVGAGLKATCRFHSSCKCWVTKGGLGQPDVLTALACWAHSGVTKTAEQHGAAATEVKTSFGMRVRCK